MLFLPVALLSAEENNQSYSVGFGLTGPYGASGLVLSSRINNRYGVKLVSSLTDGAALQADIFTFKNENIYWMVGFGKDSYASLVKAGFGMQWSYKDFIFYWEPALALPHFKNKDNLWAAEAIYYFAPSLGIRYRF